MLRQSLLLGVAGMAFAGASAAQQRGQSRDDLLDALTRHIQICGEMTDTQARLACYDRLQTQVGGVAPQAQPTPTPLQAQPAPTPLAPPPPTTTATGSGGSSISSAPLTPQPLGVPGGGDGDAGRQAAPPARRRPTQDPNAAFDPRTAGYRPPETMGPRPQPQTAPHRAAARAQLLDAAAAGDAGRRQPDLRRFALLAGHGDAHLQHAQRRQHPGRVHLHERRPAGRRPTISARS